MNKNKSYLEPSEINQNETINTDVCIVGGGAAGISLALEFCDQNFNVLIIESGENKFKHRNQHLSSSKSIGIPSSSIMFSRRRQFGGTTVSWAGRCRPLDEIDFEKKDWVLNSGWPFNKKVLDPYYERSQKLFGLDDYSFSFFSEESDSWFDELSNKTDLSSKPFLISPSTNFSSTHGPALERSENIKVLLKSNVTEINLDSSGREVNSLTCKTVQGKSYFVTATVFILAAGALEITRLLLSSNQVQKNGVGNQNDLLGRYYMDHAHFWSGAFLDPTNKLAFGKKNI
ncbi:MAG: GMC family oxidoreductase [Chloroflexi bacterium]|jgi:choline dehydrogenase-like flavoprotein|nr:GMC family oxidoreductase [Chloroflexota bacterium]MBT3669519.1 GMC family oxidoreductase [Chloroflexota bacterium]MBT4002456.1 GMC family oxidoreductase [Chloroflexota bacterium]MBT4304462.1 GMC family oxidoreductase [Chloroflexota bacterium]MBT4534197.1 GMC family oxidoreductase [Chloroflexota bacterium]